MQGNNWPDVAALVLGKKFLPAKGDISLTIQGVAEEDSLVLSLVQIPVVGQIVLQGADWGTHLMYIEAITQGGFVCMCMYMMYRPLQVPHEGS